MRREVIIDGITYKSMTAASIVYKCSVERVRQKVESKNHPTWVSGDYVWGKDSFKEKKVSYEQKVINFWERTYVALNDDGTYNKELCWPWLGSRNNLNYGMMYFSHESYAHRISYMLYTGEEIGDLHIIHVCDNPRCVNPFHLRKTLHAVNILDRDVKERDRPRGIKPPNPEPIQVVEGVKYIQGHLFFKMPEEVVQITDIERRTKKNHITTKAKPIMVEGICYESKTQAINVTGINMSKINNHLIKGTKGYAYVEDLDDDEEKIWWHQKIFL